MSEVLGGAHIQLDQKYNPYPVLFDGDEVAFYMAQLLFFRLFGVFLELSGCFNQRSTAK